MHYRIRICVLASVKPNRRQEVVMGVKEGECEGQSGEGGFILSCFCSWQPSAPSYEEKLVTICISENMFKQERLRVVHPNRWELHLSVLSNLEEASLSDMCMQGSGQHRKAQSLGPCTRCFSTNTTCTDNTPVMLPRYSFLFPPPITHISTLTNLLNPHGVKYFHRLSPIFVHLFSFTAFEW